MADETTILQQLQHNWQTISATVSASLAGMWALMRSNVSRLEKLEEEMKGKASQTELNTAISSVRSEIESTRKELKSDLQTAKKEIRDDIDVIDNKQLNRLGAL